MTTLDKVASVRDSLAQAMAADELGKIAFASHIKKERLREIATGKAPGFDEADRVCAALAKLNGGAKPKVANGKATETPEPDAEPLPEKPKGRAARVTAGAEPVPTKRKRLSPRGGKQIGAAAAKRKAQAESKPTKGSSAAKEKMAAVRAARSKGAQGKVEAEQRIHILAKKNPHREGSRNAKLFGLLEEDMTISEFVKKVDKAGLQRALKWLDWSKGLKHVSLRK